MLRFDHGAFSSSLLSTHSGHYHFVLDRPLSTHAINFKRNRAAALAEWRQLLSA